MIKEFIFGLVGVAVIGLVVYFTGAFANEEEHQINHDDDIIASPDDNAMNPKDDDAMKPYITYDDPDDEICMCKEYYAPV